MTAVGARLSSTVPSRSTSKKFFLNQHKYKKKGERRRLVVVVVLAVVVERAETTRVCVKIKLPESIFNTGCFTDR